MNLMRKILRCGKRPACYAIPVLAMVVLTTALLWPAKFYQPETLSRKVRFDIKEDEAVASISPAPLERMVEVPDKKVLRPMLLELYRSESYRLRMIDQMLAQIETEYVLLSHKKKRIALDLDAVKEFAYRQEKRASELPSQIAEHPSFFLAWIDRMRSYLALFQDTGLSLELSFELPQVSLGMQVELIDQAVIVTKIDPILSGENPLISLGDEILAIDGKPVDQKIVALSQLISQSSPQLRRELAAKSLTRRSFSFPSSSSVKVQFRSRRDRRVVEIELPWHVMGAADPLLLNMLAASGMTLAENDAADTKGRPERKALPLEIEGLRSWYGVDASEQEEPAYQTGFISRSDLVAGIIRISSLEANQLRSDDGQISQSWAQPISDFIKTLKEKNRPLILDMRSAISGELSKADRLVQMLTRKNESYASFTQAIRLNPSMPELSVNGSYMQQLLSKYVGHARMNQALTTVAWTHSDQLGTDSSIAGYDEMLAVMISPACRGVCELTAHMLRAADRAVFVGTETNGSSAAFLDRAILPPTVWKTPDDYLQLPIPNRILGRPGSVGRKVFPEEGAIFQFCFEHQPVIADYPVYKSVVDLSRPQDAIYQAALNALLSSHVVDRD